MPLKIVICSKYRLFREGLKALFPEGDAIAVVGEAVTSKEVLALLKNTSTDVVLMDPVASDPGGARVIDLIAAAYPHVKVLLISMSADSALILQWLRAGASSYIDSYDKPAQLKATITAAAIAGRTGKSGRETHRVNRPSRSTDSSRSPSIPMHHRSRNRQSFRALAASPTGLIL